MTWPVRGCYRLIGASDYARQIVGAAGWPGLRAGSNHGPAGIGPTRCAWPRPRQAEWASAQYELAGVVVI